MKDEELAEYLGTLYLLAKDLDFISSTLNRGSQLSWNLHSKLRIVFWCLLAAGIYVVHRKHADKTLICLE